MNTKLLRKIKKHILEEPKRFVMHSLILTKDHGYTDTYTDDANKTTKFAACGTAACIAGWATILSGKKEGEVDVWDFGSKVLELNNIQTLNLFDDDSWPQNFGRAFHSSKSRKKRAEIAADRIEHFIKTKGSK